MSNVYKTNTIQSFRCRIGKTVVSRSQFLFRKIMVNRLGFDTVYALIKVTFKKATLLLIYLNEFLPYSNVGSAQISSFQ